ncbi:MAG: lactate utilization protein C [Betaproteobacteria bacterium]|nr:lactate utilization protein C [Betaproteobacteria bacterium]
MGKSNEARAKILGRIRKAQSRAASGTSQAELEAVQTYLRAHPRGSLPVIEGDLVARFRERAESMQSTTEEVANEVAVPAAVARYLRAGNLPLAGCVWPQLAQLDWKGAGLSLDPRAASRENGGDDLVGVTGAFAALAETGTLVLVSGPKTPGSVSLVPETHIAVLRASRIVAHMEEAWDMVRAELRRLPRAVTFISGPSRTGDIEQQLVLGAHGPYRVHIIIVRD